MKTTLTNKVEYLEYTYMAAFIFCMGVVYGASESEDYQKTKHRLNVHFGKENSLKFGKMRGECGFFEPPAFIIIYVYNHLTRHNSRI